MSQYNDLGLNNSLDLNIYSRSYQISCTIKLERLVYNIAIVASY